jgi:HD superfamily phosphohydrolase
VARRALYDTVYNHKTVRIAESMVGLLLRRLRDLVRQGKWLDGAPQQLDPFRRILGGDPLSPAEILQLDDHGLGVLIDLAARSSGDRTLRDLAGRILARHLFKQFPVSPERLAGFNTRDAMAQLQDVVAPYVPGRAQLAQYYVIIDNSPFKMLSQQFSSQAYFVEVDAEERLASPVRDHPQIRGLFANPQEFATPRLFAPAEAHDALQQFFERTG